MTMLISQSSESCLQLHLPTRHSGSHESIESDPNGTYLVMCHQKDTQLATESTEEHGNIS